MKFKSVAQLPKYALRRSKLAVILLSFTIGFYPLVHAQILTEQQLRDELLNVDDALIEEYKNQMNGVSDESNNVLKSDNNSTKIDSFLSGEAKDELLSQKSIHIPSDSIGSWVNEIHGMSLFFNNSIPVYQSTSPRSAPAEYILDVGDKIAINIFGKSQADFVFEVASDGFIRPNAMSKIYLKGLSLRKAKLLLENRFGQRYAFSSGEFIVTLHTARSVRVHVFGEVQNPGSYALSAMNSALGAIIFAGGPLETAGLRKIEIHSSEGVRYLDVFQFLSKPSILQELYLNDNDLIYVPKYSKRITLTGSGIRTTGVFELKENESFTDAIYWANGFTSHFNSNLVQHLTTKNGIKELSDYTIDEITTKKLIPADEDIFEVKKNIQELRDYVSVSGAVLFPGRFELTNGMRVSDVITLAQIDHRTYTELAYITRKNADGTVEIQRINLQEAIDNPESNYNITLREEDQLEIYSKESYTDKFYFSITGAVRKPGRHPFDVSQSILVSDVIKMAQGLRPTATNYGYIISTSIENPNLKSYKIVNLKEIMANVNSSDNIQIKANDRIVIPNSLDVTDEYSVKISGEVRSPGNFTYHDGLTVNDMLLMAGGIKLEAATNRIDIYRLNITNNEPTKTLATSIEIDRNIDLINNPIGFKLQPFDHIVIRRSPNFNPIQYVYLEGEVKYPGEYALLYPNERIRSVIDRAGGFTDEAFPAGGKLFRTKDNIGFIITQFDKIKNRRIKSRYNVVLRADDRIIIPQSVDIIRIDKKGTQFGHDSLNADTALNMSINHFNKRAGWYVRHYAGGFSDDAIKRKTCVKYSNGKIKRTRNLVVVKFYPKVKRGSEILLVTKSELKARKKAIKEEQPIEKSLLERMTELNAITTISTSIMVTTQTLITIINGK